MTVRAIERAGCRPEATSRSRSTSRPPSSAATAATRSRSSSASSTATRMAEMLLDWIERYPIASIEDPFGEDDRAGWIAFSRAARPSRADHRRRLPDDQRGARRRGGGATQRAMRC